MLDQLATHQLVTIALTFCVAGFVKGVLGLGLPTLAMGLLGLVMPAAEAAALLVLPSLVTNLWQLLTGPRFGALLRRLWPMLGGICIGTWSGAGLIAGTDAAVTTTALGWALAVYAMVGLTAVRMTLPSAWEPWLSPPVGAITGLVTAATGVFVIPAVPFLQALGLTKDDLVQALGLSFTVSTIALAASLAGDGAYDATLAGTSLLATVPALAGMALGQWARGRLHPESFRRWFFLGLLALGLYMAAPGSL